MRLVDPDLALICHRSTLVQHASSISSAKQRGSSLPKLEIQQPLDRPLCAIAATSDDPQGPQILSASTASDNTVRLERLGRFDALPRSSRRIRESTCATHARHWLGSRRRIGSVVGVHGCRCRVGQAGYRLWRWRGRDLGSGQGSQSRKGEGCTGSEGSAGRRLGP